MNVQLICGTEKEEFEIKILIQESTLGQQLSRSFQDEGQDKWRI
jgi:hypothetical protein